MSRTWRARAKHLRDHWVLAGLPEQVNRIDRSLDDLTFQMGQLAVAQRRAESDLTPDVKVFSQWGEDGIIAWLLSVLGDVPRTFVEIGVEDYRECNTRFLARQGWRGLAIDADQEAVARAKSLPEVWSGAATVVAAWAEPDNINDVIEGAGLSGEIGVLSVDIDGTDFYLLDAIAVVHPAIVVVEYNARYGPDEAVTVPYRPGFDRRVEHSSWLHHGVSLAGLEQWGTARGYDLVAVNQQGTNAFLVASSKRPDALAKRTAKELWRPLTFSEFRDGAGVNRPIPFAEEQRIVASLPKVQVAQLLAQGTNEPGSSSS